MQATVIYIPSSDFCLNETPVHSLTRRIRLPRQKRETSMDLYIQFYPLEKTLTAGACNP